MIHIWYIHENSCRLQMSGLSTRESDWIPRDLDYEACLRGSDCSRVAANATSLLVSVTVAAAVLTKSEKRAASLDSHSFEPIEGALCALAPEIRAWRLIGQPGDSVIDCKRQLIFCVEIRVCTRTNISCTRGVSGYWLGTGLTKLAERRAVARLKFEAPKQRDKSVAKRVIRGDRVYDVQPADHLGLFTAKPGQYKKNPPIAWTVAQS